MANKAKKCRKDEKFTFWAKIQRLAKKWWEIIILVYELLFHNTDCTNIPK